MAPRPITETRLLAMMDASGDSFWELDTQRRYVYVSGNMQRSLGYSQEEIIGKSVMDFMTPSYKAEIIRLAIERGTVSDIYTNAHPIRHEGEFLCKDGTTLWAESVSVPVFDDNGVHIGYFGITRDTTQRKLAEQSLQAANAQLEAQVGQIQALHAKLQEQAIRDDLTGAYNRRHFAAVAENEISRARRQQNAVSLVMLDLDHFKRINDSFGHFAGDEALRATSTALAENRRAEDLVCRWGGEEFAVLLPGTGHDTACALAEAWRVKLASTTMLARGTPVQLTASLGVATFPLEADSLLALMQLADARLYQAKARGRNCVVGAAS